MRLRDNVATTEARTDMTMSRRITATLTTTSGGTLVIGQVVDDEAAFTTVELCRACGTTEARVEHWVGEGVLQPAGARRDAWRFGLGELAKLRVAERIARDLDVNAPGVALALDLLDRISALEGELTRSDALRPARGR